MYRAYVYLYVVFMYVCCWPLSSTCELSWWRDVYFPLLRNTLLWSIFLQSPVSLPYSKVSKNLVRIYWKISLIYKPHAYLSFQHSMVLHTRGRCKFSLADIKKIFCRSDLWSKISHVLVVQLDTFSPMNSLMSFTVVVFKPEGL